MAKGMNRSLSADEKWKLSKWIEENKEKAFLKAEKAAEIATMSLGFSVSSSSILTHRGVVYPEMRRASPTYRPGAKTFIEFTERIKRIETFLQTNFPKEWGD
jgi:hypothetical protein